jgi:hypothetical protein
VKLKSKIKKEKRNPSSIPPPPFPLSADKVLLN